MSSSKSGGFNLFETIFEAPDLLELVVQQCRGNKKELRLACSRLRAAVDACVTRLAWDHLTLNLSLDLSTLLSTVKMRDYLLGRLSDFGADGTALSLADFVRCPRLQALDFNGCQVADLSPLVACIGLRKITRLCSSGDNLAPFVTLTRLEHLDCSHSPGLSDISALAACTALKYLDCSMTGIQQLPPLPCLETLICRNMPLPSGIAFIACTALKHLDCGGCSVSVLPPLPASLETLDINGTQCADLSPLAACTALRRLGCVDTLVHDLTPLAVCALLRWLDCTVTPVRNLLPLMACKRLEFLECDDFDGAEAQTSMLIQACPGLDITITGGN